MSEDLVQSVVAGLKEVRFPGLSADIVALGYVKDIQEVEGRVVVVIEMSTQLPEAAEKIETAAREVLTKRGFTPEIRMRVRTAAPGPAPAAPTAPTGLLPEIPIKIAVASGKGGVGKSTVAVNLALALAKLGRKVGLLDCDIYGPSIPLMMGMENEQPLIRNEKLVPLSRYGVRTISIGYLVPRETPVIWRGPMVGKALDQLMADVDWSGTEILVLDLPPGTGDIQITLSQKLALTGAIIVTTPQEVALIDAGKGFAMFEKVKIPVLGILENMSRFVCPHCGEGTEIFRAGGGRREAERLGVPLLGEIPIDPRIVLGGDLGTPIVEQNPDSPAGKAFFDAARRLLELVG
jgi:ATP-binding protein involved in chromosome partitioning